MWSMFVASITVQELVVHLLGLKFRSRSTAFDTLGMKASILKFDTNLSFLLLNYMQCDY